MARRWRPLAIWPRRLRLLSGSLPKARLAASSGPASSTSTRRPAWARARAATPPVAPDPTTIASQPGLTDPQASGSLALAPVALADMAGGAGLKGLAWIPGPGLPGTGLAWGPSAWLGQRPGGGLANPGALSARLPKQGPPGVTKPDTKQKPRHFIEGRGFGSWWRGGDLNS